MDKEKKREQDFRRLLQRKETQRDQEKRENERNFLVLPFLHKHKLFLCLLFLHFLACFSSLSLQSFVLGRYES